MINSLFIGAIVILILMLVGFGMKLYYDVSIEQRKKKFEYIFKIIMKNGSEYEYHFYSNSNKKSREYLLKNFIMENDREIAVEEDGFESYYPLNEVAKMKMSCRPAKQKIASGRKKQPAVDFDSLFVEDDSEQSENSIESPVMIENEVDRSDLSAIDESSKVTCHEESNLSQTEEKQPIKEDIPIEKEKPYQKTFDVPKKKNFLSEFNRVKKTPKRDSFKATKAVNSKWISIVTAVVLLFVCLSGVFAFLGVRSSNGDIKQLRTDLTKKTKESGNELDQVSDSLLEAYLNPFVGEYLTISDNKEALEKRNNQLKTYFSFTTDFPTLEGDRRVLTSKSLYDVEKKKDYYLVTYDVSYDLFVKKVGEDGKINTEKKTKNALFTVPVYVEKERFTIIDLPYFSDKANLQSTKAIDLVSSVNSTGTVSTKDTAQINDFLNQFLTKYATGKKEDLVYLMEKPEGLNGLYKFKETTNKIYLSGKNYTVLSKVTFEEAGGSMTHIENMKLTIEKKDGKYFVKKLDHVLGGN